MEQEIKKRSYHFSLEIIKFINSFEYKRVHYSLVDQLLRSATSVGANLIEARAAHSKKDFIKFYEIALKSSNETKYWLCLVRDGLSVDKEKVKGLLNEADEISKIVAAIIIKLKKSKRAFSIVKESQEKYDFFDL